MNDLNFGVNIDPMAIIGQHEKQTETNNFRKNVFDAKNYLNARLAQNETSKTLTIRLLPFSSENRSPFKKVITHTVKVNKEVSPSGWKTFICPEKNVFEDAKNSTCPFCEASTEARNMRFQTTDEVAKKRYGDIEFMYRAKDSWLVRCIERGHEDDGVKFWLFNDSKKKDGVYDKMYNLFMQRSNEANGYNIFDLNNGKDLIITITRDSNGKSVFQIIDAGVPTPLSSDEELANKWINDNKKWTDVYTVKSYEYMTIIGQNGVPVFNKELGKYVNKNEVKPVSEDIKTAIQEEDDIKTEDEEDLPF